MARMIPPECGSTTPAGERELFNKLKLDPSTEGWVVLHSLDLKKHLTKIEGELDMVILVPNLGILCVEVKGCDVSRIDGKWIYPYETSLEGPFKQASRSMHSLRKYVVGRDVTLKDILFFSCVFFTRIDFEEKSPEWHPWQAIGKYKFLRQPISKTVIDVLSSAHDHIQAIHGGSWYTADKSKPTNFQVERITNLLRENFEYSISPRTDVELIEENIAHFTEEQYEALDILEENPRVIFKGPAGTGKTFLALETARRAAAKQKKVLLLSFNNLLGDWLRDKTTGLRELDTNFDCRTFHGFLLKLTGDSPKISTPDYWTKRLPNLAVEQLLDGSQYSQFYDLIIVDEAQDLMRDEYLDILDLVLIGGLSGGCWALFGDFERQAIYASDPTESGAKYLDSLSERSPQHTKYTLRNNCRNALPIADLLTLACKLKPGYKRVLNDATAFEADLKFYRNDTDQLNILNSTIEELLKRFKHSEITILSTKSDQNCVAALASEARPKYKLTPIRDRKASDEISYTSIYSFKGMESPAIILTDIEDLAGDKNQALLYVGISRARVGLVMLMNDACRVQYNVLLDN